MADRTFIKGFRSFKPHGNAPQFVKGQLIVDLAEFRSFIEANPSAISEWNGKRQLKIQVTESREGALLFSVDDFKPQQSKPPAQVANDPYNIVNNDPDDLPF